jgi:hypothetical protein
MQPMCFSVCSIQAVMLQPAGKQKHPPTICRWVRWLWYTVTIKPMLTPSVSPASVISTAGFLFALHSPGDSAADIQPVTDTYCS